MIESLKDSVHKALGSGDIIRAKNIVKKLSNDIKTGNFLNLDFVNLYKRKPTLYKRFLSIIYSFINWAKDEIENKEMMLEINNLNKQEYRKAI
jgi:hypothetical protein